MTRRATGVLAGALLLIPGILLSAPTLVSVLHGSGGDAGQLLLGANLFRAVLVVTGLYFVLLGYLPFGPPRATTPTAPVRRSTLLILLGLTAAAALLRGHRLGSGIWLDEMLTYINYMPLSPGAIFTTFDDPNNHLFYTLLAKLCWVLFGAGTATLRLPAVLFGVASIPAVWHFARQVSSEREALFAAALVTFSYHHIWFSQDARGYTALLFFTLLSSTLLIRALRSNRLTTWLLYALSAALGVFTHLTMGFVIVAQFVIYVVTVLRGPAPAGLERWAGLLAGFMVAGLLSCLAYAFVLPQMLHGGMASGAQGNVVIWTSPVWMVLELLRGLRIGFAGGVAAVLALLVFAVGLFDLARHRPVVPVLLLLPTGLGFLVMVSIHYTLFPRFFFFAMGFAVVVVVHGCMLAGNALGRLLRLPGAEGWPGTALCAGLVALAVLSASRAYGPKQDYRGALDLVNAQRQPGDAVVTVGVADIPYHRFYHTGWGSVGSLQQLDAIRAASRRTWVVYTMPTHTGAAYPEISASLKHDFTEVGRFPGTLHGGTVVVCRAPD